MATVTNTIKKLEKNGFIVTPWKDNKGIMTAKKDGYKHYIDIYRNGGDLSDDVAIIDVRNPACSDDIITDYHAGIFCRNISQAIRLVNDYK